MRRAWVFLGIILAALVALACVGLARTDTRTLIVLATNEDTSSLPPAVVRLWLDHFARFDPNDDESPGLLQFTLNGCVQPRSTHCFEVAEMLHRRGAKIDRVDAKTGLAPLHAAMLDDSTATLQFLLSHGANPNVLSSGRHANLTPVGFAEMLKVTHKVPARDALYDEMMTILRRVGGR